MLSQLAGAHKSPIVSTISIFPYGLSQVQYARQCNGLTASSFDRKVYLTSSRHFRYSEASLSMYNVDYARSRQYSRSPINSNSMQVFSHVRGKITLGSTRSISGHRARVRQSLRCKVQRSITVDTSQIVFESFIQTLCKAFNGFGHKRVTSVNKSCQAIVVIRHVESAADFKISKSVPKVYMCRCYAVARTNSCYTGILVQCYTWARFTASGQLLTMVHLSLAQMVSCQLRVA